ncbi:hypothetical protein Ocin01_10891, partial [Orchesella cincta]
IPVAKPRKSTETTFYSAGTGTDGSSFGAPSPIPTPILPVIHLEQHHHGSTTRGAAAEIQSLSESEPEYLTIIQPEEFHEEKHDNSIPNPSTVAANKKSQPFLPAPVSSGFPEMNKSGGPKSDEVSDYTLSDSVDEGDDEQNNARTVSFRTNDSHQHHHESIDHPRGKSSSKQTPQMTDIGLNPESTAIGLEEMGRALRHLKFQRRSSGSQI